MTGRGVLALGGLVGLFCLAAAPGGKAVSPDRAGGNLSSQGPSVVERQACTGCHSEHRGVLAQITEQTRTNPHGELIFRATGTNSCTACHEFGSRIAAHPTLRDEPIVRQLYEKGRGAHRPGRMGQCLVCHGGGGE